MKEYFNNLGFVIDGMLHLTGRQALLCLREGAVLVDIREDFEVALKDFLVDEYIRCPFSGFDQHFNLLPKDRSLILADCVGISSKKAVQKLLENGYMRVANLAGGIADWEKDGLPMSKDIESMDGQCPCMIRSKKNLV